MSFAHKETSLSENFGKKEAPKPEIQKNSLFPKHKAIKNLQSNRQSFYTSPKHFLSSSALKQTFLLTWDWADWIARLKAVRVEKVKVNLRGKVVEVKIMIGVHVFANLKHHTRGHTPRTFCSHHLQEFSGHGT